ncbi:MAG: DNA-deoxyinosine glycosylase [Gammaproteobacteria bacterium]|nr:DNA-deoxyinosine glycosylase [Gammaproteobacteria bacterium]
MRINKISTAHSFAPLATDSARCLVLGSMPGQASLAQHQYYAHPRNAFWPIMAQLLDFDPTLAYDKRCHSLCKGGVALWDVLQSCQRPGSLDANIVASSIVANNIAGFLQQHSNVTAIYFNGATAERLFRKHVATSTSAWCSAMTLLRMPSTSPAHAAISFKQKLAHWSQLKSNL